jgi:hypothetical protein
MRSFTICNFKKKHSKQTLIYIGPSFFTDVSTAHFDYFWLIIFTLQIDLHYHDQVKEYEMGGAYRTLEGDEACVQIILR